MPEARHLDAILADLVRIKDELERSHDAVDRVQLRDQLHGLRAEAASTRGAEFASMADTALRAAIAQCDRALGELSTARFDPSMVAGASGRGGGLDPIQTIKHNRAVDDAGGREQLEAKRAALIAELARRRSR